jgi:hypothetical protein
MTSAMNSRIFPGRPGFGRNAFLKFYLSGSILVGAASTTVQAGVIVAGAQLRGVSLGRGEYAYTLTLENSTASTSDIQMFWFAWNSGQADFLASEPTAIQTPPGWTNVVEGGGAGDGYSIQFITFTTPLTPGSSVTFTFESPDSPKIMAGPAALFPEIQTLSSQVYSGQAADGVQDVFVAQVVSTSQGMLNAQVVGPDLALTWTAGTNVVLQQISNLSSTNWTTVPGTLGAGNFTVANASGSPAAYYRLATQ